ncbi:hypothetical protein JCM19992_17480 [Thermostilla marina]
MSIAVGMDPKVVTACLEAACRAPSPDNNQPWLFSVCDDSIVVYRDDRRRLPSDVWNMFDLLALGAAVENMSLAAGAHGYAADVEWLLEDAPSPINGREPIAKVRFGSPAERDPLVEVVGERHTNRRNYRKTPIADETLQRLTAQVSRVAEAVHVHWLTDRSAIRAYARLTARADRLRFEYRPFHAELFRQLRFSPREAAETADGLDVRTLALPPGASLVLRGLRSWHVMAWLARVRLTGALTVPSAMAVVNSGAVAVIAVERPIRRLFVEAGRAIERLWLQSTRENLAVHPLGSLPIFLAHEEIAGGAKLSERHRAESRRLRDRLDALLPDVRGACPVMALRLGDACAPKVRSVRRSPADCTIDSEEMGP